MTDESVNLLCKGCGEVVLTFLKQMAEHNAEVVCPKCGKSHKYNESDHAQPSGAGAGEAE